MCLDQKTLNTPSAFFSLCSTVEKREADKATILILASRLRVDGQLFVVSGFEQNESLSYSFFSFGETAV